MRTHRPMSDPAYRAARRARIAAVKAPIIAALEAALPQFDRRAETIEAIADAATSSSAVEGSFVGFKLEPDLFVENADLLTVNFERSPSPVPIEVVVMGVEVAQ